MLNLYEIKKYYINLDRSKNRRKFMENTYNNIIRIDAFDGKKLDKYTNSLYLRFDVKDKPGVLSEITNRFAKYNISVKRIVQTPDKKNNKATIVIITHKTSELNANNCFMIFRKNKNILKFPTLIRLYN